jgi:atypical dual specificity phosphatase
VSCGAGCGRTGTVLACYLVSSGHSAEGAIQQLLALRPCACEILVVPGQREAVLEFGCRLEQGLAPRAV